MKVLRPCPTLDSEMSRVHIAVVNSDRDLATAVANWTLPAAVDGFASATRRTGTSVPPSIWRTLDRAKTEATLQS